MSRHMNSLAIIALCAIAVAAPVNAAKRKPVQQAAAPAAAAPATGVCYLKADGSPSAFDAIDTRRTGAVNLDIWKAYYGQRYSELSAERKKKTNVDRYLKYAGARFKGLDKDRNGQVTCAEYKASIERMKAARVAKAAAAAKSKAR